MSRAVCGGQVGSKSGGVGCAGVKLSKNGELQTEERRGRGGVLIRVPGPGHLAELGLVHSVCIFVPSLLS